ncbi:acetyl-CoA C-acetyltransferase [Longimicrobium terrae]|uniref:Acetyl-CoA C-acetyltransferase n=1 Tax=Longimicrobium terrae TaxID=1639882 RepID=A0A841H561_9BACT|nr:acetyl-CoA C-acetyltransferase [Longimicrobium terrae]MBB4639034.1 acetyl-CoA C-acetyltransferase [Longimicrobium terrae]MBB6073365.1 acetyl-CoA C-acetyltransferase [Longimicrobium terrae]NNC28803.1 acetyl-CoA C-acetyltransferase [Longimicrobium terrae]
MADAYIIDAVRTPRGRGKRGKGSLTEIHPQELLAQTLNALAGRTHANLDDVDDVVVGAVSQVGEQGANIARQAVLAADWPVHVGGVSLNRYCGSGLQAVNFAAMGVMSGMQELVVGAGVESMSRVPMGADGGEGDGLNPRLRRLHHQVPQGISADLIATMEGFSREELDAFALRSQRLAAEAQAAGRFTGSLFPVLDPETGAVALSEDEYLRPDTTIEALAGLKGAFAAAGATAAGPNGETLDEIALARFPREGGIRHLHTAGNSSGIVDGAAAVLIASPEYARANGLKPRARIRSMAILAEDPVIMLTAPAETARKALRKAGMEVGDIDLWEINEAFAAVPLQVIRRLGIDIDRVNVNGGSIALGHPLGATGAILLGTALDELERRNLSTALITLCIAGGQGVATVIERV